SLVTTTAWSRRERSVRILASSMPCSFFAAWYSKFSDRSPCSRAVLIAWTTSVRRGPSSSASSAASRARCSSVIRSCFGSAIHAVSRLMRRYAPTARSLVVAGTAAWVAGFAALSVLRNAAFATGRFDLGNMVQAVWSTAHGHLLRITDLNGDQISRLGAHVDPILVLFAPLWWVWPSPDMLLTVQAIAVGLGALPVFWLGRKHLGS